MTLRCIVELYSPYVAKNQQNHHQCLYPNAKAPSTKGTKAISANEYLFVIFWSEIESWKNKRILNLLKRLFWRNNKIISVALNTYLSGCLGHIFLRHRLGMYCLFLEILHLPIRCFCNSWWFLQTEFQKNNLVYHGTNLSPFVPWDPLRSYLT